jgi:protoheme IX farnesyltransferase
LVAVTVAAGFALASPPAQPLGIWRLLETVLSTSLVSAGAAALNHALERRVDARMRRTASRPIAAGRISQRAGGAFGVMLSLLGTLWLALRVGWVPATLALGTCVAYVSIYTPLKTRTPLVTLVGAIPGATPPLIGWLAAAEKLELGGWILFVLLYLWQLPHVIAIAWLHGDDYRDAGIRLLPFVGEEALAARRQAVLWSLSLLPVSLWPVAVRLAGPPYLVAAALASLGLLTMAIRFAWQMGRESARGLIFASVFYLPVILIAWVLDHRFG